MAGCGVIGGDIGGKAREHNRREDAGKKSVHLNDSVTSELGKTSPS